MKTSTRGHAALAALMLTAGITAMITIGLDARRDDLGREDVLICRLQARLSAESAIAVAAASIAGGRTAPARGDDWTLAVKGRTAEARGRCDDHEVVLRVTFDGAGRAQTWDYVTKN